MKKVEVKVVKTFVPHTMLLDAAHRSFEASKDNEFGRWYDWLNTILYCAISVEAIGNTYGESFVPRWKDFESSSPIAKIRIVTEHCGLTFDTEKQPWAVVPNLIKFRNRIAHAKLEDLTVESVHTTDDYEKHLYKEPQGKLEKMVTRSFAENSLNSILEILKLFGEELPTKKVLEIEFGNWSGGASIIHD